MKLPVAMVSFAFASLLLSACGDNKPKGEDVGDDTSSIEVSDDAETPETSDDDATTNDVASPDDVNTNDVVPPDDVNTTDVVPPDDVITDTTIAPSPCGEHGDCTRCTFPTAPATLADCYCRTCDTAVLSATTCMNNAREWQAVCGDSGWQPPSGPCPMPRCAPPPPVACINDMCIDACNQADCPDLPCPTEEQMVIPGQCCPRCVGDNTCTNDGECTMCAYGNAPANLDECRCPICPVHPMTESECTSNNRAFDTHCGEPFREQCPVAICLPQREPFCGRSGYCEQDPFRCQEPSDCIRCPWGEAPTNAAECGCAGCGVPMPQAKCDAIRERIEAVCTGFDFEGCAIPSCPNPPELTCETFSGQCIMNFEP